MPLKKKGGNSQVIQLNDPLFGCNPAVEIHCIKGTNPGRNSRNVSLPGGRTPCLPRPVWNVCVVIRGWYDQWREQWGLASSEISFVTTATSSSSMSGTSSSGVFFRFMEPRDTSVMLWICASQSPVTQHQSCWGRIRTVSRSRRFSLIGWKWADIVKHLHTCVFRSSPAYWMVAEMANLLMNYSGRRTQTSGVHHKYKTTLIVHTRLP